MAHRRAMHVSVSVMVIDWGVLCLAFNENMLVKETGVLNVIS